MSVMLKSLFNDAEIRYEGCIVCDVLSYVVANAKRGQIWITHHTHPNIVAVALLKELAAVIIAGGGKPDAETVNRASEEGIPLHATSLQAYDVARSIAINENGRGGKSDGA